MSNRRSAALVPDHGVPHQEVPPRSLPVVSAVALLWFGASLWAAYRTIAGAPGSNVLAVVQAAFALPTIAAAGVLAGLGAGLCALTALARRRATAVPVWLRTLVGGAGGLVVGALGAAAVLGAYGSGRYIPDIDLAIGASAVAGGLLATLRPAPAAVAGLAGACTAVAVGLLKGAFDGRLAGLFGAAGSAASTVAASQWLELAGSLVSGIAAGLVAFWYLRRSLPARRWPAYLAGGGTAGVLLFAAEVLVRLVGSRLTSTAGDTSPADRVVLEYLAGQRLQHALVVFFAGAVVALLAFGRTLPSRSARG